MFTERGMMPPINVNKQNDNIGNESVMTSSKRPGTASAASISNPSQRKSPYDGKSMNNQTRNKLDNRVVADKNNNQKSQKNIVVSQSKGTLNFV